MEKILSFSIRLVRKTLGDPWQFGRYLIGGFSAFIVDFLSYAALVQVFHVPAGLTPTVSAPWVITYAFLVQKYFTFRSKRFTRAQLIRYGLVILENWVISTVGLWFLVQWLGLDYRLGKVIIMVLVVFNNFPIFKFWVFPSKTSS